MCRNSYTNTSWLWIFPYEIEWDNYLEATRLWRRNLKNVHGIPIRKELTRDPKLATGHNSLGQNGSRLIGRGSYAAYHTALSTLDFMTEGSIFSVYAIRGATLYGHKKLEAALYALFQRMQKHCEGWELMRWFSLTKAMTNMLSLQKVEGLSSDGLKVWRMERRDEK